VCNSRKMRMPYLRAHAKDCKIYLSKDQGKVILRDERSYFQDTFSRNGSSFHLSMAQNGTGNLIQFRPAPAISAKSFSVWEEGNI